METEKRQTYTVLVEGDGADLIGQLESRAQANGVKVKVVRGLPKVMGASEVADALGIARSNVYKLLRRGLPGPAVNLRCGQIWLADDVKQFNKEWRRRRRT